MKALTRTGNTPFFHVPKGENPFDHLPDEMVAKILGIAIASGLSSGSPSLKTCSAIGNTCRRFYNLSNTEQSLKIKIERFIEELNKHISYDCNDKIFNFSFNQDSKPTITIKMSSRFRFISDNLHQVTKIIDMLQKAYEKDAFIRTGKKIKFFDIITKLGPADIRVNYPDHFLFFFREIINMFMDLCPASLKRESHIDYFLDGVRVRKYDVTFNLTKLKNYEEFSKQYNKKYYPDIEKAGKHILLSSIVKLLAVLYALTIPIVAFTFFWLSILFSQYISTLLFLTFTMILMASPVVPLAIYVKIEKKDFIQDKFHSSDNKTKLELFNENLTNIYRNLIFKYKKYNTH